MLALVLTLILAVYILGPDVHLRSMPIELRDALPHHGRERSRSIECSIKLEGAHRPDVDWRDFDDAPKHATNTAERQETTEYWLQLAAQNQARGISPGIAGTTVFGEVLARPPSSLIDGNPRTPARLYGRGSYRPHSSLRCLGRKARNAGDAVLGCVAANACKRYPMATRCDSVFGGPRDGLGEVVFVGEGRPSLENRGCSITAI